MPGQITTAEIHAIVFAGRTGMQDVKTRARETLAEMDLIRAGLKPSPLTKFETDRILASVKAAPSPALSAADQAKIMARLNGKPDPDTLSHKERVAAHVKRLRTR